MTGFFAEAAFAEPAVPPGQHPGGVSVALVGAGIDYRTESVHARLARDGEGELTGYDFVDGDRQPYAAPGDTVAARVLMREAPEASLVVVRTDFSRADILAPSLAFVLKCPAPIIVLLGPFSEPNLARMVETAALHFPNRLIIVAAGDGVLDLDLQEPPLPKDMSSVLVVTAATPDGTLLGNRGMKTVDMAVSVEAEPDAARWTSIAAARTAAIAAEIASTAPDFNGQKLKRRLIEIAKPLPAAQRASVRYGWIQAPETPSENK